MHENSPLIWLDGASGTLGKTLQHHLLTCGYRVAPLSRHSNPNDATLKELGTPHGLVCCSGRNLNRLGIRTTASDWRGLLDANLLHPSKWIQAVLPELMRQGEGSIVLCSSLAAQHPRPGQAAYGATKGAIESLTRGLAQEVGVKNIRVNAIAPGFIDSPMWHELPEKEKSAILRKIPMGRLGTAHEIAVAVEFLLSNQSAYMTGQILHIDGGIH